MTSKKIISDAEFGAWCERNKPCRYCQTWFVGPKCPSCEGPKAPAMFKPLPALPIPGAIDQPRKSAKPQGNPSASKPGPIPAAIKSQVTLALSNKRRRPRV
jgi:hypothetical protein